MSASPEFSPIQPLFPREAVPPLELDTVEGNRWSIHTATPQRFTMLVFYRGLHCPVCRTYLEQLARLRPRFEERGTSVVAISSDTAERARQTVDDWDIDGLEVAHSLDLEVARTWGLYVSSGRGTTSIGVEEPRRFSEPAIYLVQPDGSLYFGAAQTMPFARPEFRAILGAIDYVIKSDYPARGEVR